MGHKVSNGVPNIQSWVGNDGEAVLVFSEDKDGVSGRIVAGRRAFLIGQHGAMSVLVEPQQMPRKLQ